MVSFLVVVSQFVCLALSLSLSISLSDASGVEFSVERASPEERDSIKVDRRRSGRILVVGRCVVYFGSSDIRPPNKQATPWPVESHPAAAGGRNSD